MSTSPSVTVVLPAAGTGSRFGQNTNKLFELFDDQPLWRHAVERFACRQDVRRVILAVSEQDRSMFAQQLDRQPTSCPVIMVRGGARRTDSVRQALASIVEGDVTDLVAIHDAARPLVRQRELDAVFAKAMQCGAAILAA
ncbi:MAG: 2-C-methyl-D-erythritol 4-phosphate cytidylyltransferase, partial [Planctomycetota bacterium]